MRWFRRRAEVPPEPDVDVKHVLIHLPFGHYHRASEVRVGDEVDRHGYRGRVIEVTKCGDEYRIVEQHLHGPTTIVQTTTSLYAADALFPTKTWVMDDETRRAFHLRLILGV